MKSWWKTFGWMAAAACGLAVAQGCTGGNGGRYGTEQGYNALGEKAPFERKMDVADERRAGPTRGMLVTPAPTIAEGNPYGVTTPPPSATGVSQFSMGNAGVGGSGLPPAAGTPGRARQ